MGALGSVDDLEAHRGKLGADPVRLRPVLRLAGLCPLGQELEGLRGDVILPRLLTCPVQVQTEYGVHLEGEGELLVAIQPIVAEGLPEDAEGLGSLEVVGHGLIEGVEVA